MKSVFSTRMAELRREKGLSQREAAAQLGISQALLSHYENGAREPKFEFVSEACDFYEVTADYLFGRTDERKTCARILSGKVREIVVSLENLREAEAKLIDELNDLIDNNGET